MRTLSLLFALLLSQSLTAESWQDVKAVLQANYPEYDSGFVTVVNTLLYARNIAPDVLRTVHVATQEMIEKLPGYIQGTINQWPNYWKVEKEKWSALADMHHAKCILAGAVQLRLALAVLRGRNTTCTQTSKLVAPAALLLIPHPSFGPLPDDVALRKILGEHIAKVKYDMVANSLDKLLISTSTMLSHLRDCKQVQLGYSSPASS